MKTKHVEQVRMEETVAEVMRAACAPRGGNNLIDLNTAELENILEDEGEFMDAVEELEDMVGLQVELESPTPAWSSTTRPACSSPVVLA